MDPDNTSFQTNDMSSTQVARMQCQYKQRQLRMSGEPGEALQQWESERLKWKKRYQLTRKQYDLLFSAEFLAQNIYNKYLVINQLKNQLLRGRSHEPLFDLQRSLDLQAEGFDRTLLRFARSNHRAVLDS